MQVDVQLNAAALPWPALVELAGWAELEGFDALWVFDHLAGENVRGSSMIEAFTLLGALAATTQRVALGTLVLNVFHRQPAIVAVAAASVVALSGGRPFLLGLGAGASPTSPWSAELRAVGQPIEPTLAGRHARVAETIETCRRVWADDRPAALATMPLPRPTPELHVGVSGVSLAQLAGRVADGINVAWEHPRRREILAAARAARADSARRDERLVVTTYSPYDEALRYPDHPDRVAMAEAGIDRLILIVRQPVEV